MAARCWSRRARTSRPSKGRAYPIAGTWSIAELVAHVLDSDLVFADRIKRLIAEDSARAPRI